MQPIGLGGRGQHVAEEKPFPFHERPLHQHPSRVESLSVMRPMKAHDDGAIGEGQMMPPRIHLDGVGVPSLDPLDALFHPSHRVRMARGLHQ